MERKTKILLASLSGLMLGIAFPPVPTGVTALFAFVPFFLLFESIKNYGQAFRYTYLTFFIFNSIALYWTGGFVHCRDLYMMIAGVLLLLAHPLFFYVPVAVWILIRKQLGFKTSLFIFPFLWIGFEYLHSLGEVGFPWLTLGNTQTYDREIIQFAEFTGVYGISFWLLWINVIAFILFAKLGTRQWKSLSSRSIFTVIIIMVIYALPKIYGNQVLKFHNNDKGSPVRIAIIQPNIDTFEKWTVSPELPLLEIQKQTDETTEKEIDLVLWPETAVPFYLLHQNNQDYFNKIKNQVDTLDINLLAGIPDIYYFRREEIAPQSCKVSANGIRYETYNSSVLIHPNSQKIQKYAKIVLVPFAERVPFSEELSFLNIMKWNFGLGGWGHGRDTTIFQIKTSKLFDVKFSNMICYESVCPDLVRTFVQKGAQFLTVLTNDSWWGNTSGPYQHKQYAVLRAVENRRWVVQCANGGISCFVDPFGTIRQESDMYTRRTMFGEVMVRNDQTFYTRWGDWLSEYSLIFSLFFIIASLGNKFYHIIRKRQADGIY